MSVPAILVMWSGPVEQNFRPISIWNLSFFGPVMFENIDGRQTVRWRMDAVVIEYQ